VACFIKAVFRTQKCLNVSDYCVKPIVVTDKDTKVSTILNHFVVPSEPINKISCSRKATVVVNWQGKNQKILTSDDLMTLILG
jgi:hypothetical protein